MDLIDAAKNGNVETVLTHLESGYGANTRDKDDATALYWSACHGHNDVTEILISAGCDVNATVRWGSTALHAAADRGHLQCVQILINSGARTNSTNDRGDTPLHIAAYRGFMEITRILLLAGSDVTFTNEKGKTPQEEAMEGGNHDIADCIRVFVTEGHFSLCSDDRQHPGVLRQSRYGNGTIYCNTQTSNVRSLNNGRVNSISSECSSDFTDSTTSSTFNSTYSFPEDSVDSGTEPVAMRRSQSVAHLKRSVSFGGTHKTHRRTPSYPTYPSVLRTASAESVQCQLQAANQVSRNGDVMMTYSNSNSVPIGRLCVSERNLYQSGTLTNCAATNNERYSSAPRQGIFTNTDSSLATESTDYSTSSLCEVNEVEDFNTRFFVGAIPLATSSRSSTGSMREIVNPDADEIIARLQTQLVQTYRHIEGLTKENEHLKFKSSTLLERLNEAETNLSAKSVMCENLTALLETERSRKTVQADDTVTPPHGNDVSLGGFRELARQFAGTPNEIEKRLIESIRSMSSHFSRTPIGQTKEWLPGVDYVILGDPPISAWMDDQTPRFVSFLVKHLKTNQCFILKMAITLEEVADITHTTNNVLREMESMTTEYHSHPNVIKVLHQFEASTDRLKKFVYIPSPSDSHLPQQQLSSRTMFLVTPYMLTLSKLIDMGDESRIVSMECGLNALFWIQVLYQLSSLLCLLEDEKLTFGEVDKDTVCFDEDLVPYLRNIENVVDIKLCSGTNRIPMRHFKSEEKIDSTTAIKLNNKADATSDVTRLCELFHDILCVSKMGSTELISAPRVNADTPHIVQSLRHILSDAMKPASYLFDEPNTASNISKRFGFLLYGPGRHEVKDETDCFLYHQTHMLKLLTEIPRCNRTTSQYGVYTSMEESVRINRCRIEAHFLSHVTSRDLWNYYQTFEQRGLLVR